MHVLHKPKPLTGPIEILIDGCRRNELQSQEQLYRLFYADMIRICYRYAGDMDGAGTVYNNAMLRVFKTIRNYRHENKLGGWVRSIVVHACIDYIKERTRFTNKINIGDTLPEASEDAGIPGNISAKEIQWIINQLPAATSAVFNLYIYENFSHKQIGESLGISEGTSKWHVSEARKRLRISLKEFLTP